MDKIHLKFLRICQKYWYFSPFFHDLILHTVYELIAKCHLRHHKYGEKYQYFWRILKILRCHFSDLSKTLVDKSERCHFKVLPLVDKSEKWHLKILRIRQKYWYFSPYSHDLSWQTVCDLAARCHIRHHENGDKYQYFWWNVVLLKWHNVKCST